MVILPSDPRIGYIGRVALSARAARLAYPGLALRFVYRGPAPTLRFEASTENCYFNLSCNGWDPVVVRLKKGASEFALPSGAAPRTGWFVELVRRTEAWQGVVTFKGLALPKGATLLPAPPLPKRRLLVIGDSITGGEFVERLLPENLAEPRTANAARSFGMLLARACNAQVHLVSYGGRGVMRDWRGLTNVPNAPEFFERTLPDEPSPVWDHRHYTPQAVLVCLGTNDCGAGIPDAKRFTETYATLVARVRAVHPKAGILLCESPIFGTVAGTDGRAKRDFLRRALKTVVQARHRILDTKVALGRVGHYPGTPADGHPVAFQHEQMALELLPPLRALTGW